MLTRRNLFKLGAVSGVTLLAIETFHASLEIPPALDRLVGYMGMVELTMASWYANPRSWNFCSYAGPPVLF